MFCVASQSDATARLKQLGTSTLDSQSEPTDGMDSSAPIRLVFLGWKSTIGTAVFMVCRSTSHHIKRFRFGAKVRGDHTIPYHTILDGYRNLLVRVRYHTIYFTVRYYP